MTNISEILKRSKETFRSTRTIQASVFHRFLYELRETRIKDKYEIITFAYENADQAKHLAKNKRPKKYYKQKISRENIEDDFLQNILNSIFNHQPKFFALSRLKRNTISTAEEFVDKLLIVNGHGLLLFKRYNDFTFNFIEIDDPRLKGKKDELIQLINTDRTTNALAAQMVRELIK